MKLEIELVPRSSWYSNVRSNVDQNTWDIIRRKCYKKAGYKCEICGGSGLNQGAKHSVECHEIWHYDDIKHIQRLTGFVALCPLCHMVKHIGLAEINGKLEIALEHYRKVNNISYKKSEIFLKKAWKIWKERSEEEWNVDISLIDSYINENHYPNLLF